MDDDPYRNAITEALITQYYGQPGRGSREGDKVRAFGNVPSMNWNGQPFRPSPPGMDDMGNPLFGGTASPQPVISMPPIPNPQQLPSYISKGAGTDPSIPPPVRMPQPVDELPPGYYK